jgi:hypothetical protein
MDIGKVDIVAFIITHNAFQVRFIFLERFFTKSLEYKGIYRPSFLIGKSTTIESAHFAARLTIKLSFLIISNGSNIFVSIEKT